MADTIDREYLLTRAAQLVGKSWSAAQLREMTDEQLESLVAETEMSQSFWEQYDKEVAEIARSSSHG